MPEELFGFNVYMDDSSGKQYLVLDREDKKELPLIRYQAEMIVNNSVPGLLSMDVRRLNDQIKLYYLINDYLPLDIYLEREKITRDEFILFLNHIKNILNESKKYLLNENSFILKIKYIYVKKHLKDIAFIYVPASIEQEINFSLKELLQDLSMCLPGIDDGDPVMRKFFRYLKEDISVSGLERFLKQLFIAREIMISQVMKEPATDLPRFDFPHNPFAATKGQGTNEGTAAGETTGIVLKKDEGNTGRGLHREKRMYCLGGAAAILTAMVVFSLVKNSWQKMQPAGVSFFQIAFGMLLVLGSVGAVLIIYLRTRRSYREEKANSKTENSISAADADFTASVNHRKILVPVIYKKDEEM